MKKAFYISNITKALLLLILLIFIFTKNEQLIFKFIIIFFILMLICYIAKNICAIINKPRELNFFNKLFITILLLYSASFLIIWSYSILKEGEYLLVFFTIPAWIFIIYLTRKHLLDKKTTRKDK